MRARRRASRGSRGDRDLPADFVAAAQAWLGEEAAEFLDALRAPPSLAVRPNAALGDTEALERVTGPAARAWPRVPWWPRAALPPVSEAAALAAGPLALLGAIYAQDAASLLAVAALDPRPGERILDLCAAPGGKSTAILDRLLGEGLLASNDIDRRRARDLVRTLEQWGARATIVSQCDPRQLAAAQEGFFDRVLVDAPCSGEAMFGRREFAGANWSLEHVQGCARRQQHLLESARQLVRPGGVLVYTTCTFNPRENEEVILAHLDRHGDDLLDDLSQLPGVSPGRADLLPASGRSAEVARCARIWPHRAPGMGHFAARIIVGDTPRASAGQRRPASQSHSPRSAADDESAAVKHVVAGVAPHLLNRDAALLLRGANAYLAPRGVPESLLNQAMVPGLHVAEKRGTTWRPAHALAKAIDRGTAARSVGLSDEAALAFLKGQPFPCIGGDGLTLAIWMGLPLGWGRQRQGVLASLLPSGLRLAGTATLA